MALTDRFVKVRFFRKRCFRFPWRTLKSSDTDPRVSLWNSDYGDPINDNLPEKATFFELAQFRLVSIRHVPRVVPEIGPWPVPVGNPPLWEILLLEELRYAVHNGFQVSDYFLTTSAVGTIVQGDLTIQPNANYQSAASISGNIIQTVEQLSSALEDKLGTLLDTEVELRTAIMELRLAKQSEQIPKIGKVIVEFGRCLQHGANAATILSVLPLFAQYLQQIA